MTLFEGWAKLCAKNNTVIWPLCRATDRPECGLYMTQGGYWSGNNIFYDNPVYQVWIDDNREYVTQDFCDAITYWKRIARVRGIEYTANAEKMRKLKFNS